MNPVIEKQLWGEGNDYLRRTLSRRLEETPDMYIFLESWDQALSRKYHFAYAISTLERSTPHKTSKSVLFQCTSSYEFWMGQVETKCLTTWGFELSEASLWKVILTRKSYVWTFQKYILVWGFQKVPRKCAAWKVVTPPHCASLDNRIHFLMWPTPKQRVQIMYRNGFISMVKNIVYAAAKLS